VSETETDRDRSVLFGYGKTNSQTETGVRSNGEVDRLERLKALLIWGKKGKAVPLQAWRGPGGSRKLRFPDKMTTAQDGVKVVSLMHRPPLPPGNAPGNHFYWGPLMVVQWLRYCATNRKVAGSIPDGVIGIFH
jgi:hypothetical protein